MSFVFSCIMNQYKNIELVIFNLSWEWNLAKEVMMVCTRSGILFFASLSRYRNDSSHRRFNISPGVFRYRFN